MRFGVVVQRVGRRRDADAGRIDAPRGCGDCLQVIGIERGLCERVGYGVHGLHRLALLRRLGRNRERVDGAR